uniref:Uncharacterized protein n=1 Tax=Arcella intermedia TaxID=1963864 RepID=A0A6B2L0Y3_9EUKA
MAFAALLGRMRITKKLIKYGANPNVKTNLGYTILEHLARVFESTETQNQTQIRLSIIGFFVRKGVYMDLHSAAALGDLKTVRNLSKDPTLLNSLNELGGRSPLHMAIEYGRRDVVIVLLAAGADRNISGKMAIQFTPLQYACVHGKIQIVQLLTQHSTQLDCVDRKGRSLVTLAAENGHNELAKLLLDFGAPIQVKSIVLLEDLHRLKNFVQSIGGINKVLRSYGLGHTLLHIAVQEGSIVVVKWLLDNAADPMVLDDFKKTSIQLACSKGDTDIMNLLLISTKKIHEGKLPTPKDFEMYIREAMFAGHSDIIKLLVENGADITYRFNPTNTPHLHLAIRQESVPSPNYYSGPTNFNQLGISNILAWKEKFGTSNRNLGKLYSPRKQYSPAPILQDTNINHHNYVEIVKTLLKKGANPSQPDDHGNTPLHMAARVGSVPMMAAILSANITHIFNNEGRSVADVWQRDRSELDVLLKPLEQVFSFYSEKVPAFGGELSALDIPKSITTRIFAFLDRKTLHIIVPCVSHKWRILYQDFVLEKKRKKLGLI